MKSFAQFSSYFIGVICCIAHTVDSSFVLLDSVVFFGFGVLCLDAASAFCCWLSLSLSLFLLCAIFRTEFLDWRHNKHP